MVRAMVMWFLLPQVAGAWKEHVLELPDGGRLGLSTRGRSLRVRWPPGGEDIREVSPADPDAAFHVVSSADGEGIAVPELGSLALSKQGLLQLRDARGALLTQIEPLGRCRALKGQRPQGGHVLRQATLDAGACCQACLQDGNCTDWSTSRGTCVLLKDAAGWYADEGAMAGRPGLIIFNSSARGLYGRGAGPADAEMLLAEGSAVSLANRATYVPYFYSRDGYAVLGHSNVTNFNMMAVRYQSFPEQGRIAWAFEGAFQLHFMLAPSLAEGTKAYYALTGRPPVPPRHAFGFMACRWGWPNQRYLEETVQRFREGNFPLDSVILDFEWFANSSDYAFTEQGEAWYEDFGWNPELFPSPAQQLKTYLLDQQLFVAGIRKPRLGNRQLLHLAKERKWIAPEGGPETYAKGRWLRFSDPTMQRWYAQQMQHYVDSGISFWWNDEGENFYYTYHEWNLAEHQLETEEHRFFSLNRAFTPGMARLGTGVWTGDVGSTWEDLRKTPGMMLNWALAGAPYVACDIGGFFGNPSSELLTRWFQVGTFMPLMRTHSHHDSVPHWPWLYPDGEIMRTALTLRYRLLPYHYSLAHRLSTEGELFVRPLAVDFPEVENLTTQWMDGEILVAPVLSEDSKVEIYLPEGRWHPFDQAGQVVQGPLHFASKKVKLSEVPAFVRLGTVLTLAPATLASSQSLPGGPLEVQVYAGADGHFTLIEDDGRRRAAPVRRTSFVWDDLQQRLSWTVQGQVGQAEDGLFRQLILRVFAAGGSRQSSPVDLGLGGTLSIGTARSLRQVRAGRFVTGES